MSPAAKAMEEEIVFLGEHIKMLRRMTSTLLNQVDRCETRIDDLRRAINAELSKE